MRDVKLVSYCLDIMYVLIEKATEQTQVVSQII